MHRPGPSVLSRVFAAMAAGALLAGTTACGSVVSGEPTRLKPDLSGLNVGNYPTEPIHYGTAKDKKAARYREGQRLGDFVALPFEADPTFVKGLGGMGGPVVLDRRDMQSLVINDTFDEIAPDLIAGWVHTWGTDGEAATSQQMSIAVLMFPNAATAETVAGRLEHDDFTFNTDNRPVQLPKYPHSKAHWRPGVTSLGSWTSHDRYVVFVKYNDLSEKADLPSMVQHTEAMLDVQMPLLDQFEPTPADQLEGIQLDPDGVLALALPKSEQVVTMIGPSSTFRGRGALHALGGLTSLEFLHKGQVSAIALAETVVMESRSATGAEELFHFLGPNGTEMSEVETLATPPGIDNGNTECFRRKDVQYAESSSFCILQTGRYFAQVEGSQIQDLHQKTAAQYALLANV